MPSTTAPRTQSQVVSQDPVQQDTIPKIFFQGVDTHNRSDALRYKENGQWHTISHREAETRVTRLAAALERMGIQRGDRVALLSENRPEWALADYAVLGLGAMDVPVYPTLPANQIAYILRDAGAKAIFVSTSEQLAKVLEIRDQLPDLQQVIAFDDPGGAADVRHWPDVLEQGRQTIEAGEAANFREQALQVGPDDTATLIYTSGTTGDPKGVMLTHFNLASNVAATLQHGTLKPRQGQIALSFLPLSHVFERMVDYVYWNCGIGIAYAESIDKVADNLVEVRPHLMVSVPRLFDKIYTKVMGATGVKKALVGWAKRVGETFADHQFAGTQPPGALALQYQLADKLVFSKLRAKTGGRITMFVSGGAPLSAEVGKFFFAAGLPVYEGYGLTETSPVITANKEGKAQLGTVGTPIPGVEVRIAESGEILTRGPNVMKGYWNRPDATAEVIDDQGWFHTGDVGELDAEGYLRITDRIKNLIVTAGGKNIAPQPIENQAAMSPYVAQVVMIGDKRAYPTMVVVPDFDNLSAWAKGQGITATGAENLVTNPQVQRMLEADIANRLQEFARYEMPKKFAFVPEEFTIDAGLLTPSMKVKRKAVEQRYQDRIESMYQGTGEEA